MCCLIRYESDIIHDFHLTFMFFFMCLQAARLMSVNYVVSWAWMSQHWRREHVSSCPLPALEPHWTGEKTSHCEYLTGDELVTSVSQSSSRAVSFSGTWSNCSISATTCLCIWMGRQWAVYFIQTIKEHVHTPLLWIAVFSLLWFWNGPDYSQNKRWAAASELCKVLTITLNVPCTFLKTCPNIYHRFLFCLF